MRREGFEPFAPQRAVAASSGEKAVKALGCPDKWFKLHFRKAGKRDGVISEMCREAPEKVFELHFEEFHRNGRIEREHHWVPVEKVGMFLEKLRENKAKPTEGQVRSSEAWKDRVKNVKKPISLRATA